MRFIDMAIYWKCKSYPFSNIYKHHSAWVQCVMGFQTMLGDFYHKWFRYFAVLNQFCHLLISTEHLLKLPVSHIMQCFETNLQPDSFLQIICLHRKHLRVQKSSTDVGSEHRRAAVPMLVPGISIDMMPNIILVNVCTVFQALWHCAFAKSLLSLSDSGENCVAHYAPLGFLAESVWRQLWGT